MDDGSPLVLVEYIPDLLGEAHGFGCLLFDTQGLPAIVDGSSWLYTTVEVEGLWQSWARPFDLTTLKAGPARRVLAPHAGSDSAVFHHVLAVAEDLYVGIFCDGPGIGAAIASSPEATFKPDPDFAVTVVPGWETRGGGTAGWTLECNGACVPIAESATSLTFWQGYDSYRAADFSGDLGWVGIHVDKESRRVHALDRHPGNPLPFRREGYSCARCGGNLAADLTIAGKRPYFYYTRPSMTQALLGLALSSDPLFQKAVEHHLLGTTLGEETVMEKFQAVQRGEDILLFHESRFRDGSWHTGLRRYRRRDR